MLTVEQIKKLKNKETGKATLAVNNAEIRETSRKTTFLSLTLGDRTGHIGAKIWDWNSADAIPVGDIIEASFEFSPYNDVPQMVIRDFKIADKSKLDAGLFVDTLSPVEFKFYREELEALIREITNAKLRDFILFTLYHYYPQYMSAVGGKVNHHSKLGGLLQHSVRVTRSAQAIANSYKGTPVFEFVDMDLLIAGALLHDLGKIGEYTTQNMVIEHTVEGNLMTHYDTGPAYLMEAYSAFTAEYNNDNLSRSLMNLIIHIMVTHHGTELSTHSPSTVSAWFIHSADISDCFTDAIISNLDGKNVMSSEKVWVLKNRVIDERLLR